MAQLQKKANYSRICQLLIGKGGSAFRCVLQTKINKSPPPSTLDSFLNLHKPLLQSLRLKKAQVINPAQWNLLFPPSFSADLNHFDITLLTILLRNICGLPPPAAGWNVMPSASDTSMSAEILRIKFFRNEVYGHISFPELDNTEFERLWQEISEPLVKLGIPQQDINELKKAPLSPEEETYLKILKEWKERDDELMSKLNDVEGDVDFVKKRVTNNEIDIGVVKETLQAVVENAKTPEVDKLAKFVFIGKSEQLVKKFQNNTRKWFFEKFKRWLHAEKSRVMILTAGPGVGKSVLCAKICELLKESGQLIACHFCDFRSSDSRDPYRILQSLASQMCDNIDGFREKLSEALSREHSRNSLSDAFRIFLNDPLHALNRNEPMLIVIDALDESKTATKSEVLELISEEFSQLPKWIRIFITSRPELQVKKKLKHLDPLEIRPDDELQWHDLEQFIEFSLPKVSVHNLESLVDKCEGSFLYAYYLVNEVKQKLEIEQDIDKYVPQGISGFYKKQFKRLKTELQRYEQNTEISIFKSFLNVVAASQEPLPFRTLLACLGLSNQEFEIREAIIGIMSEILPVYDDCLTVFHKSLWDWLKLDGYEEHAYAADVADGKKRLWRACKKVYMDIASLSSVGKFQISLEKRYALENGWKYLISVGDTKDFELLVHVKVNYFMFKYSNVNLIFQYVNPKLCDILQKYKSRIPNELYWRLSQLYTFSKKVNSPSCMGYMYLQYLAVKDFALVQNATPCKKDAKDALDEVNTIWFEEVTSETDSSLKISISGALFHDRLRDITTLLLSPDNKLLVWKHDDVRDVYVDVHELPNFTVIFQVHLGDTSHSNIVFSPDSSYFLLNSLQTCVSMVSQKKVPFIPNGPAYILFCSFSSCGTKLVTAEDESIKMWNVREKVLLAEIGQYFMLFHFVCFSSCDSYIFVYSGFRPKLVVFDSITLSKLETNETRALPGHSSYIQVHSPLYFDKYYQSALYHSRIHRYWQLPTGEKILGESEYCSKPFTWKARKCVIKSDDALALIVYDYINQEVVDTIEISSLRSYKDVRYLSYLGENSFLISLDNNFVFVFSLEISSESLFFPFPFICDEIFPLFFALSPDNLYVAYSYGSPYLRIMNVDNGRTLQIMTPKKTPIACWWSQSYLWVVCSGLVVTKYPYNFAHLNVENYVVECYREGCVLKFAEGVLVTKVDGKISISKIIHECLSPQQILDSLVTKIINNPSVQILFDGDAVLLYGTKYYHYYEVWEIGRENKWQLFSAGTLDLSSEYGYIIWKKNSSSFLWLSTFCEGMLGFSHIFSIDLSNGALTVVHKLPVVIIHGASTYLLSDLLICKGRGEIHFIQLSDGKVISSIPAGKFDDFLFVPAKRLLFLFRKSGVIKRFNIHNIDKFLPLF